VVVVSYGGLKKLTRLARGTIAKGLTKFAAHGLLTKIKRRIRTSWHQGGQKSQQATNAYVLNPPADHSEFSQPTVPRELEIIQRVEPSSAEVLAAQEALARRRRSLEEQLLRKRNGGIAEASATALGTLPLFR
jgi:hypothetical protein